MFKKNLFLKCHLLQVKLLYVSHFIANQYKLITAKYKTINYNFYVFFLCFWSKECAEFDNEQFLQLKSMFLEGKDVLIPKVIGSKLRYSAKLAHLQSYYSICISS